MLVFGVLCSVCFCSYASESVAVVHAESVYVSAGETVSIPVVIANNPGIMGFSLLISFDDAIFTPVSVTAGDMLSDGWLDDSIGYMDTDTVKVSYSGTSAVTECGTLFNIDFDISDNASGECSIEISYIENDTFNEIFEKVRLDCENISVNIENGFIENAVKFYGDSVDATAGQDITVPIRVENAEKMNSFVLAVTYDSKVFTFKSVQSGDVLTDGNISSTENSSNSILLEWNGSSITQNGSLMYITFNIADYIEEPTVIGLQCNGIAFSDGISKQSICINSTVNISNPYANEPAIIYTDKKVVINEGYADVPVYICNNHGLMGLGMIISYDNTVLNPISVTKGTLLSDGNFENNIGYINDNIKINWSNTEDVSGNGLLLMIRFKILTEDTLRFLPIEISYSQENTFNEFWEDIELNIDIPTIPVIYGYTAKFVADGVVVSIQSFTSDTKALDEPEIPPKAGYVTRWDYYKIEKKNLVIKAKYDLPSVFMISKCTLKVEDTTRLLSSCNFEVTGKGWSSSNPSVAVVDNRGNVTAVGKGKCTIKVTCCGKDSVGNEIKASASTKIVVNEKHEVKNIKKKFKEAFEEFFEQKIYDFFENLKKFILVLLQYTD